MIEFKYAVPFLTLFIGMFIGNRLAIGRDKRKEYNEVVLPIKQKILDHIDYLNKGNMGGYLNHSEVKSLRGLISENLYQIIKIKFDEYNNLVQKHMETNEWGEVSYSSVNCKEIASKVKKINEVLKLK